ncbi:toll/interleukin-1 receptor domain-containing protein [Methanobrevibacter sp.]
MDKDNAKEKLYSAYVGNESYMFVSYAHLDADIVFPEIARFQNDGYNVWYDEGIAPGNEWPEEIANALARCSLFVVFITQNSVESKNVRNEIYYALHHEIPFIAIHLEETELEGGLALSLQAMQAILKYTMADEEYIPKYTKAFKNNGFYPSDSPESKNVVQRTTKPKKSNGFINDIKLALFYWKDNKGNIKIAKTKIVSLILFIIGFIIPVMDGEPLGVGLMLGLFISVPVFVILAIVHYFISR